MLLYIHNYYMNIWPLYAYSQYDTSDLWIWLQNSRMQYKDISLLYVYYQKTKNIRTFDMSISF